MTNLEMIQQFGLDEMAAFLYTIVSETETKFLKSLNEAGIDASIVKLPPKLQIAMHRKFLLEEVKE